MLDMNERDEKNVMTKVNKTQYFIVVRPQDLVMTYVHLE